MFEDRGGESWADLCHLIIKCAFMGCLIRGKGGLLRFNVMLSRSELICTLENDCSGLWWGFLVIECVSILTKIYVLILLQVCFHGVSD